MRVSLPQVLVGGAGTSIGVVIVDGVSSMEKNLYVWGLTIFAAFGGFMFGYDIGQVRFSAHALAELNVLSSI